MPPERSKHSFFPFLLSLLLTLLLVPSSYGYPAYYDAIPEPYSEGEGAPATHELMKAKMRTLSGEDPFVTAEVSEKDVSPPQYEAKWSTEVINRSWKAGYSPIAGRLAVLDNPIGHFSVLPPLNGGCAAHSRTTVTANAALNRCHFATNGGFMVTSTGACLGNVVSNCAMLNRNATQNAHFGMTRDGRYVVGYLPEEMVESEQFAALVGGVIWLVREGKNYVKESSLLEDSSTQETGSMRAFIDVTAPRTAIGHDIDGRLMLIAISGNSRVNQGVKLSQFADYAISLGMYNGINLDGGGSTAAAVESQLVTFPSDLCTGDKPFVCERPITTVTCFHDGTDVCAMPAPPSPPASPVPAPATSSPSPAPALPGDGFGSGMVVGLVVASFLLAGGFAVVWYRSRRSGAGSPSAIEMVGSARPSSGYSRVPGIPADMREEPL